MALILVVDDDINILEVIKTRLEANGFLVEVHSDPLEALDSLKEKDFDAIVTDIRMPQIDGMEFLRRVRNLRWEVPVILLTAYGTIPNAVEAMKQGAFEYLTKPFQGKQLVQVIERALEEHGRFQKATSVKTEKYFSGVYGISPKMKDLYSMLDSIIHSDSTVLIQGESGTGKELIAQMIHYNGSRERNRFVIMDCGATPSSLIESELFGHAKGSFTSATENRKGLFEIADKGTLFLDEVASMPLDLQTRLLRGLEEGEIKRVGENLMREVDVRVITATNRDLRGLVNKGLFRLDLYYRLAVVTVALPPLRERKEDIPLLADYFVQNFSRKMKKGPMQLGEDILDVLTHYEWPGNIRELKNTIEAAIVFAKRNMIALEDIVSAGFPRESCQNVLIPRAETVFPDIPLPEYLERQERTLILRALEKNDWIQKRAAKQLGISPRVLNYKMKIMRIEEPKSNAG